MIYRRCGRSGLLLPAISLGLWQNFGSVDDERIYKEVLFAAFDNGITHFDLANNYGPLPGSAEENLGRILSRDFKGHRDELVISTKAGYTMWAGPYGDWGSKKYLVSSLDQSLRRLGLNYVDIFYHHRPDPDTPLEETMDALVHLLRQGKALYIGLSNYPPETAEEAFNILRDSGVRCLIHQPKYSMLVRDPENGLLEVLARHGVGCIAFSPLAQGLLTNNYLYDIPKDSRAMKEAFLKSSQITPELREKLIGLNGLAEDRGQTLAQMAIAWLLKDERVTSVLIGARHKDQLLDSLKSIGNISFSQNELDRINKILG